METRIGKMQDEPSAPPQLIFMLDDNGAVTEAHHGQRIRIQDKNVLRTQERRAGVWEV